jgi:nudix-type nucleoside diphosphatase (YffH/AdpP family)
MSDKPTNPSVEILASRRLAKTPALELEEHRFRYRRRGGSWSPVATRNTISRGDAASAILFEPETQRLHFVRQFRFPAYDPAGSAPDRGWLVELVAGMVDPGETPGQCIIREVEEETGFIIQSPTLIGRFYLSPGVSRERLFLFYAEVSAGRRKPPPGDAGPGQYGTSDEDLEMLSMSVPAFLACVERMEIADAKTLAAAEYLRRARSG